MRETTKEIELSDGARYRLTKLPAETASRIFNLLMATVMKARQNSGEASEEPPEDTDPEKRAAGTVAFMWMLASADLDEKAYTRVQFQCLYSCARLDGDSTVPVRMADGRWAAKELENDAPAVNRLVTEVLQFNIAPFFLGGASSAAAAPPTAR